MPEIYPYSSLEDQGGMDHVGIITEGLFFALQNLNVKLRFPTHFVESSGDCAIDSFLIGEENISINNPETWSEATKVLN